MILKNLTKHHILSPFFWMLAVKMHIWEPKSHLLWEIKCYFFSMKWELQENRWKPLRGQFPLFLFPPSKLVHRTKDVSWYCFPPWPPFAKSGLDPFPTVLREMECFCLLPGDRQLAIWMKKCKGERDTVLGELHTSVFYFLFVHINGFVTGA